MGRLNSNKDRMMENTPAVIKHPCGTTLYGFIIGSGPAAGRMFVYYRQDAVARDLPLSYSTASAHMGYSKVDIESAGYVLTPLTRID